MIHLKAVEYRPPSLGSVDGFPFNVPALTALGELQFDRPVTFFVGENGSGKSTLLEALALAVGSITVGTAEVGRDMTLAPVRPLARQLRLSWRARTRKGFFMRAEDFFGYARRLASIRAELEAEMTAVDDRYEGRSEKAKGLARMPYAREIADMQRRFGEGLDARSHGEGFLELFQQRFRPGGLYLLDEPEAALSPLRQIGFLALLKEMVSQESQFVIATHSPILLAFPEATILSFDEAPPARAAYETLPHVTLTKDFLANPAQFLQHF